MTIVEGRISVWEALAGRAPGQPTGPANVDLWRAVDERLDPARARPVLRPGIEHAALVSVRGVRYVMLRSPDTTGPAYLRLAPEEWQLAELMDGTRTVARLVADFARITGRLAPEQVTRVVADLAGNRMLAELPVDVFRQQRRPRHQPSRPRRLGHALLAAVRGRRAVVGSVEPLVNVLYLLGGRLLFTRVVAFLGALVAVAGLGVFGWQWQRGTGSLFLVGDSYLAGVAVLLGLNVVALACHELGHALGARHAGRRVPAAGFLVYFGIPSVFVDTSDVWMAGRRARLVTTAAGPATGLILAGVCQLVGFAQPELAPWAFKLAFVWYLNALFNLNPFMALDGYYLLMDWLEIPNLRARGLAWISARLHRRRPSFDELDGEGRLIALYGVLAVAWLAVAANLGYRLWLDRISGFATGLWRSGWPGRALFLVTVAGLVTPMLYAVAGGVGRSLRRTGRRWRGWRDSVDAPRRSKVLAESALGGLPTSALQRLAAQARWVYPRTGRQLVTAGEAQPEVFVVVDGALEGRRPGDPSGTVRERVTGGGVVGLAGALIGAPATLTWHTAGTTLLAVPAPAVAAAIGPVPGPPPGERAELEALLAELPALSSRSEEDRIGLISQARPVTVRSGESIEIFEPDQAYIVAGGSVRLADGAEVGRGAIIGPLVERPPGPIGMANGPVRLWSLLGAADLPASPIERTAGHAPTAGAHPRTGYPPLAHPPGPPPAVDEAVDRRLERRLWRLLVTVLTLALLLAASNFFASPGYAEMPTGRALLTVERGDATAVIDGRAHPLEPGGRWYVGARDEINVPDGATARLIFRGGATAVLCGGTGIRLGSLTSHRVAPVRPAGALTLGHGQVLLDTRPDNSGFSPLRVAVTAGGGTRVASDGPARFSVAETAVAVTQGSGVRRDDALVPATGDRVSCGDGTSLPARRTLPATSPSSSSESSPAPSGSASSSPSDPASAPAPGQSRPGQTRPRPQPPVPQQPQQPTNDPTTEPTFTSPRSPDPTTPASSSPPTSPAGQPATASPSGTASRSGALTASRSPTGSPYPTGSP